MIGKPSNHNRNTNTKSSFVTLACFSVVLFYPDSLFSYFTIIILSVMTAVTFPLRPPRLAFAICGWRWQIDVHEIKYSVVVSRWPIPYTRLFL